MRTASIDNHRLGRLGSLGGSSFSEVLVVHSAIGAAAEAGDRGALLALGNGVGVLGLVEDETRVAEAESDGSKDNHDTLKDDERDLVLDELTIITILQLGDTVDASSEDQDDGGRETGKEGLEAPAKVGGETRAHVADHVVAESDDEEEENDDLQDQTSHRDVDTNGRVAGRGGHGTTSGLEDEADDIEGDEDPVEELGLEARELGGEENDRLGEGDIDGRGVEDGSDGKADYDVLVEVCKGAFFEAHQFES